jgi:hypothetical protein
VSEVMAVMDHTVWDDTIHAAAGMQCCCWLATVNVPKYIVR